MLLDQVFQFLDKTSYQEIEDPLPVKGDLVATGLHVNSNDFVITVTFGKVTFAPFTNDQWTFDNLGEWKVMLFIINEIDAWLSKGFKTEIFALASGDGELKMTFNNLMLELSKEAENSTLRQNLYRFAADVVRSLLYS